MISFSVQAWEKDLGYSYTDLWISQGIMLETNGYLKRNVEIAFSNNEFGISFYNFKDKSDQSVILGHFNIRTCGEKVYGDIEGPRLIMDKANTEELAHVLKSCKTPLFIKVYNELGNFATYKVVHTEQTLFKDIL
ncbi:hypothetical protein NCTGTJJY_CDS0116 [Serratia phage 92A1]|nr:hypothetical protein NCTGTJJY_CDS0116 [Serratia phage 92A1]